jgi:hypothetical protein
MAAGRSGASTDPAVCINPQSAGPFCFIFSERSPVGRPARVTVTFPALDAAVQLLL